MNIVLTKEKIANGPTVAILFWKVISWLLVRVIDTSHKSKMVSSAYESSSPSSTQLSDILLILLSFSLLIFVEGALQVVIEWKKYWQQVVTICNYNFRNCSSECLAIMFFRNFNKSLQQETSSSSFEESIWSRSQIGQTRPKTRTSPRQ